MPRSDGLEQRRHKSCQESAQDEGREINAVGKEELRRALRMNDLVLPRERCHRVGAREEVPGLEIVNPGALDVR